MNVRKIVALMLFVALLLPGAAFAKKKASDSEDKSSGLPWVKDGPLGGMVAAPDHQIFVNVLGLFAGTPTIGYEQVWGDDTSFTGQFGYRSQGATGYNVNYLSLVGSYRWWMLEHAKLQGLYVGPYGNLSNVGISYDSVTSNGGTLTTTKASANAFSLGLGAEGGYQWILPMGITFSGGLNAAYYFGSLALDSGAPAIPFGGFGVGLSGTLGYAF